MYSQRWQWLWLLLAFGNGCLQQSVYSALDLQQSMFILSSVNLEQGQQATAQVLFQTSKGLPIERIALQIIDPTCQITPQLAQADQSGRVQVSLADCQIGQHRLSSSIQVGNYQQELEILRYLTVLPKSANVQEDLAQVVAAQSRLNGHIAFTEQQIQDIWRLKAGKSIELTPRSSDALASYPPVVLAQDVAEQWGQIVFPAGLMFRSTGEQTLDWLDEEGQIWQQQSYKIVEPSASGGESSSWVIPSQVVAGIPFSVRLQMQGSQYRTDSFAQEVLLWQTTNPNALLPVTGGEMIQEASAVQRVFDNLVFYQTGVYSLQVQSQTMGKVEQLIEVLPGAVASLVWTAESYAVVGSGQVLQLRVFDVFSNLVADPKFGEVIVQLSDPSASMLQQGSWQQGTMTWLVNWQQTGIQQVLAGAGELLSETLVVDVSGVSDHLGATYPNQVAAGALFDVHLQVLDANGQLASQANEIAVLQTSDANGQVPAFVQFSRGQAHLLGQTRLQTVGQQTITLLDIAKKLPPLVLTVEVLPNQVAGFVIEPIVQPIPIAQATPFRVVPVDAYGNPVFGYQGTVVFDNTDPNVLVTPSQYTFTGSEQSGAVVTPGVQVDQGISAVLRAVDAVLQVEGASAPIAIRRPVMMNGTQDGKSVCVIFDDGAMKCWGQNEPDYLGPEGGILGYGDPFSRGAEPNQMGHLLPQVNLGSGRSVIHVAGGNRLINCAVLDGGRVKCWGGNGLGQLGLGDYLARGLSSSHMGENLPYVDLGTNASAVSVTVGGRYVSHAWACAILTTGGVKCWGSNELGQLGLDDTVTRGSALIQMGDNLPEVALGTGRSVLEIKAGGAMMCALLDTHDLKCWGANDYRAEGSVLYTSLLGMGDAISRGGSLPSSMGDALPKVQLGTGRIVRTFTLGTFHGCVVLDDNGVKCWGSNVSGSLGLGDYIKRGRQASHMGDNLPYVDLNLIDSIEQIAAGTHHTCVRTDTGIVKCWGDNRSGQLGLGDTAIRGDNGGEMGNNLPAVSLGIYRAIHITAMGYGTCAIFENGRAKCWGGDESVNNTYPGVLGIGDTLNRGDDPNEMGDQLPWIKW